MASFSSRGPTMYDYLAKPDLVAPGHGTISLSDPVSRSLRRWSKGATRHRKGTDVSKLGAVERRIGAVAGKTTADGQVSIMTARCLGACGLAPVAVYDGQVAGNQGPEAALEHMKGWLDDGSR